MKIDGKKLIGIDVSSTPSRTAFFVSTPRNCGKSYVRRVWEEALKHGVSEVRIDGAGYFCAACVPDRPRKHVESHVVAPKQLCEVKP